MWRFPLPLLTTNDIYRKGISDGDRYMPFGCPPLYITQLTQHLGRVDFLAFMQIFMNFFCNIAFGICLDLDMHNSYVVLQRKAGSVPGVHVPYATRLPGE